MTDLIDVVIPAASPDVIDVTFTAGDAIDTTVLLTPPIATTIIGYAGPPGQAGPSGVLTPTGTITEPLYTAEAGQLVVVDMSSSDITTLGAFILTLPEAPPDGTRVGFFVEQIDATQQFQYLGVQSQGSDQVASSTQVALGEAGEFTLPTVLEASDAYWVEYVIGSASNVFTYDADDELWRADRPSLAETMVFLLSYLASGGLTVDGQATFNGGVTFAESPQIPTPTPYDGSSSAASTEYVDTQTGWAFQSVASDYTANNRDAVIADATDGPITITLPDPDLNASVLVVKDDSSAHPVTVTGFDPLTVPHASSTYLADGTTWRIVMAYTPGAATASTVNAIKAGFLSNIIAKTAAYTAAAGDYVMATTTSASFVVTGPASPAAGACIGIKKVSSDANTVTFTPASGTVDGAASFVISVFDAENTFTFDGTAWQVS